MEIKIQRGKLVKKVKSTPTKKVGEVIKQNNAFEKLFAKKEERPSEVYKKANISTFVSGDVIKESISPVLSKELVENVKKDSLIEPSIVIEKLEQAQIREIKSNKKQSSLLSLVFLVINIILVVIIAKSLLNSTGNLDLSQVLETQGDKLYWLIGAVVLLFVMVLAESGIFTVLIKHTSGKYRPFLSYKTAITGKYYESITPLAVGAQPSQIIYMSRRGVSPGVATSIPIIKLIVYNSIFAITSLLFFLFAMSSLSVASELDAILQIIMKVLACIGLFISACTVIIIMIIALSKSFGKKLARFVVKLGVGLHILKDYRVSYNKLMKQVVEFQSSITFLKQNRKMFILTVVFCIIQILSFVSVPTFVVLAFSSVEYVTFGSAFMLWIECCVRFLMCYFASSFIPIPGGTGMMELSFICLFGGTKFMGNNIFWGFLTFRILTYYQWIVQGMILIVCDIITKYAKTRKQKKN